MLPFRSLDPFRALREPDRRRRDEERLSRSEQRTDYKPKLLLDSKSPIQVRIHLPPAESRTNFVIDDDLVPEEALSERELLVAIVPTATGRANMWSEGEVLQRCDGSADERWGAAVGKCRQIWISGG